MSIKLKKNLSSNSGFTMVEMLVVVAIIGILSMVLIFTLNPMEQFKKANDVKRKSDLAQIQRVLEAYYQDHGSYPANESDLHLSGPFIPYINLMPNDPAPPKVYKYISSSPYQSYRIYTSLDRATDSQACKTNPCSGASGLSCDTRVPLGGCNYGVTSPNVSP